MPDAGEIPWDGLAEVLRGWSGRGQLHEALAAVEDDLTEVKWQPRDIEGRAHRILLAELRPLLECWPLSAAEWLHALPAQSLRERRLTAGPGPGTDWVETRLRGWPPDQFVDKERSRVADQVLSTTLRWVLDRLAAIRHDAVRVERSLRDVAAEQLKAALSLRNARPLNTTAPVQPTLTDLRSVRRSGRPWTRLAPVADSLRAFAADDLLTYARQHLKPDEGIAERLFHLAAFGMLLKALRERGATVANLRPLSGSVAPGPAYEISLDGTKWHLWFESAAIWNYYNRPSPYVTLMTQALGHPARPLGADILLVATDLHIAHAYECKYGATNYVARSGYLQACTYAFELRRCLVPYISVHVVGSDSRVLTTSTLGEWESMTIGIMGPRHFSSFRFGERQ